MKRLLLKFGLGARSKASIANGLENVIRELETLSGSTEREFLDLGRELEQIVLRARKQRSEIAALTLAVAQTSGERLANVLEEVSRWTGQGVEGKMGARFQELVPVVRAVGDPLRSLNNAVRALRVMGVITRVESARLGAQSGGFEALASEVGSLTDAIREKSDAILEAVQEVCRVLFQTEKTTADIDSRQRAGMQVTTAECAESYRELQDEARRVLEVTSATQERYDRFTQEVGNMVAALQTHDSTRQRVEHIVDALRAVLGGQQDCSLSSRQVIELQAVQLSQARAVFLEGMNGIQTDLGGLAQIVADCTQMARELLGVRNDSQKGFLGNLDRRLAAIASAVSELAESRQAASRVASDVQQACTRMSGFVAEIETIGGRMLRLALNAEIQAVHLAETGVVMEAVAEGIRATSDSASESARAAGQALRAVELAASKMNALTSSGAGADPAEASALGGRIRQLVSDLESADGSSTRILASIARGSGDLSVKVASLREGLTAGPRFAEVSQACLDSLEQIAAAVTATEAAKKTSSRELAQATGNYTMHAEREVHNEFLGVPSAAAQGVQPGEQQAADFGDNVELFG